MKQCIMCEKGKMRADVLYAARGECQCNSGLKDLMVPIYICPICGYYELR